MHPTAQTTQIFGNDIFRYDAATGSDRWRKPHDVIATACANVSDRHTGFDAQQTYQLTRLTGTVALLFVVPDWADNVGDWAIGIWKGGSLRARARQEFLSTHRYHKRHGKDGGGSRHSHEGANVTFRAQSGFLH